MLMKLTDSKNVTELVHFRNKETAPVDLGSGVGACQREAQQAQYL